MTWHKLNHENLRKVADLTACKSDVPLTALSCYAVPTLFFIINKLSVPISMSIAGLEGKSPFNLSSQRLLIRNKDTIRKLLLSEAFVRIFSVLSSSFLY